MARPSEPSAVRLTVPRPPLDDAARELIGYLNFSSGKRDPKLFINVDRLWQELSEDDNRADGLRGRLDAAMNELAGTSAAFNDLEQARRIVAAAFDQVLPAYVQAQSDLLAHLPRGVLHEPYLLARLLEATLQASDAGEGALAATALDLMNDFLGYRPVAVLENGRKSLPYGSESHAPLPVYLGGAGTASGRYHDLIVASLELLGVVRDALTPWKDETPIRCGYLDTHSTGGVTVLNRLVVDTPDAVLLGRGSIDLGSEALDVVLEPHPKRPHVPGGTVSLDIGGTFAHPTVGPATAETLPVAAVAVLAEVATQAIALVPLLGRDPGPGTPWCDRLGEALDGD